MTPVRMTAFGVALDLGYPSDADWDEALRWILPPRWEERDASDASLVVEVERAGEQWRVEDSITGEGHSFPVAVEAQQWVERRLREHLTCVAPDHVFFHAGVVEIDGGAVIIPGHSFTGKSTLVRALIEAGCGYVSDEYAVVGADGLIHPYPRHLSMRTPGGERRHVAPEALGARVVSGALTPRAVVTMPRRPELPTRLRAGRSGPAAMALMNNCIVARVRPSEAMTAAAGLARVASYWRGHRDDDVTSAVHVVMESLQGA